MNTPTELGFHPEVWEISFLELAWRFFIALLLGGVIGFEREWSNHAAGFRTHILVCVGSATIMLLSIYGFSQFVYEVNVRIDPARLAAQVISGIGFLGAGAIMRNGLTISGLTTAASIWVVAAIGLSVGAGFYEAAILATVTVLISLILLNRWEKVVLHKRRYHDLSVKLFDQDRSISKVIQTFSDHGVRVQQLQVQEEEHDSGGLNKRIVVLTCSLKAQSHSHILRVIESLYHMKDVLQINHGSLTQDMSREKVNQSGNQQSDNNLPM